MASQEDFRQRNPGVPPDEVDTQNRERSEETTNKKAKNKGVKWVAIINFVTIIGLITICVFIAKTTLPEIGDLFEDSFRWVQKLFWRARAIPPNSEFVQLLLIAGFFGWAVRRFMNMKR